MATAQGLLSVMIGGGRADRNVAGLYRCGDRDVGGGARGARDGAKHRAGHRLGGGIARRAAVGADRTAAERGYGWRTGLVGLRVLSLAMLPAAWFAGKVDKIPLPPRGSDDIADTSAGVAVKVAFGNASFVVMTCAYFVCGMQLVFSPRICRPISRSAAWIRC
jgi:hypothetical protein